MRASLAGLALVLGCGGGGPALPAPAPPASGPTVEATTHTPVTETAPASSPAAATPPAVLAESAALAWPDEPVASFTRVDVDLGHGLTALVAQDGKPLVVIGPDRFVVIPSDGTTPLRAYANERGLSTRCGSWRGVAVAGGAFLTCASDETLVARDLETLAVRWERPSPGDTNDTAGEDDTFVVTTSAGWLGLDARSGATIWEIAAPFEPAPLVVHGTAFALTRAGLVGRDARTGEHRFDVAAEDGLLVPIPGRGVVLESTASAAALRLVEPDGAAREVPLDAPFFSESPSALLEGETLTTLVTVGRGQLEVRRYDLASRTRTARSEPFHAGGFEHLYALGRQVLVVNGHGARLLDAATLAQRWLGEAAGACTSTAVWRPTATAAPVLACLTLGELSLFVPSAAPVERHRVRVSGTTRCQGGPDPSSVRIEGVHVETDPRGHYEVDVDADDDIDIVASAVDTPSETSCTGSRSVPVPPGARRMQVDVDETWETFDASGL
ncbi:MAG: PQQ-binding-like beta-propeller repeat protein [Sandaracinus sp.]